MGYQRPPIACPCGNLHELSPTAMAVVIRAFIEGELHIVGSGGQLKPKCIAEAFQLPRLMKEYDGRYISMKTREAK